MEEEIDIRPYIRALLKNWYWVVGAAIVAGLAAAGITSLMSETYEAQATVAIVRERTTVTLNESIQTEGEVLGSRDVRSRLDALIALVESSDVARQVQAEVGDLLAPEDNSVPDLLDMVETQNAGDLIVITVQYTNPEVTALIADAWSKAYVAHVNNLYASRSTNSVEIIITQVGAAEADYRATQAALEAFISDSRIALLQNEIAAQNDLLGSYQAARNKIQSNPIDFQVNTRQEVLVNYYADLGNIELWLADARALREQIAGDEGSPAGNIANALALISLRRRIFGSVEESTVLQLELSNDSLQQVTVADVDSVINVLETRRDETETEIEALSITFAGVEPRELSLADDHPINQRIEALSETLALLQLELAKQNASQQELTQARELAWQTYQGLLRTQQEIEIEAGTVGTEVRLASNSVVPDEPTGPSLLINIVLAVFVGGFLSLMMVTLTFWWRQPEQLTEAAKARQPVNS